MIDIKQIESVIRLMSKHNITELSVSDSGKNITLKKGFNKDIDCISSADSKQQIQHDNINTKLSKNTIVSPIVGSFFRSPDPNSNPFVKIGDTVSPETTVCIIEAMKVMNEIKAEKHGKVKEVLVENAQAVEFGQPLFTLE